jgi:hypothetical protein
MWQKVPWLVRAYAIALVALVLIVIVAKVSNMLGQVKPPSQHLPQETLVETADSVPVREVYGRVDAIIRQALECMRQSVEAQQRGHELGAQVFAMQALTYL